METRTTQNDYKVYESQLIFLQPEQLVFSKYDIFTLDYEIELLKESIRIYGLHQPLCVKENDNGTYTILAGRRRYRAIMEGKKEFDWFPKGIPCLLKTNGNEQEDCSKEEMELDEQISVFETNLLVRDLHGNYLELVRTLYNLYERKAEITHMHVGKFTRLLADKLGIGLRQAQKLTALVKKGDTWLRNACDDGNLSYDKATKIMKCSDADRDELRKLYEEQGFLDDAIINWYLKGKPAEQIKMPFSSDAPKNDERVDDKISGTVFNDGDMSMNNPAYDTKSSFQMPDDAMLKAYADPLYEEFPEEEYNSTEQAQQKYSYENDVSNSGRNREKAMMVSSYEEDIMMKSCIWFKKMTENGCCNQTERIYVDGIVMSLSKFYFPEFEHKGYIDASMKDTIKKIVETMSVLL